MGDNSMVYEARLHWILFFWPTMLLMIGIFLGLRFESFLLISFVVSAFALIWLVMVWLTYQSASLMIKKKQIILRSGVFVRKTMDIPLNKVECIDISQSILGTMLEYGSLVITGTGGSRQFINYLSKPLTCRRYIEQLLHG